MGSSPPPGPPADSRRRRWRWRAVGGAATATIAAVGLASTNPSPDEFEAFAAERLADLAVRELCHDNGLPLLLRLVVRDCSSLISAQRPVFGELVRRQSERLNFGLFSLYRTGLGGQRLWGDWRLPRYGVLTLAMAGQFVVLRTSEQAAGAAATEVEP